MDIGLVHRFIHDGHRIHRACRIALGLPDFGLRTMVLAVTRSSLSTLSPEAHKSPIERRARVISSTGEEYDYHVHGGGYTFHDLTRGVIVGFDVRDLDGIARICFSPFGIERYASSLGEHVSSAEARAELPGLCVPGSGIVCVREGPFESFYSTLDEPVWADDPEATLGEMLAEQSSN